MPEKTPFLKQSEALRDLRALEAIEQNPRVSQRELAQSMGVALGIVNACVHTLARKGMVKIRGDNNRSVSYHLTKKGVMHKSALAMQWTMNTIDFYREARAKVSLTLQGLAESGVRRLLLFGASELAEIVYIAARPAGIEIVGVIGEADSYIKDALVDVPIGGMELIERTRPDAIAITLVQPAEEIAEVRDRLRRETGFERVVSIFEGE